MDEDNDSSTDPRNPDNHREHMFCTDMSCPDKSKNSEQVQELAQYHLDGLVSTADADRIYRGRTL